MLKGIGKYGYLFLGLIALIGACKEKEIYPVIPSLEWKTKYFLIEKNAFGVNDTLLGVVVSYKDGDGDIGLNDADTFPPYDRKEDSQGNITNPYFYNLRIDYFEVKNGILSPFIIPNTTDTFKIQTRISSLTPEGVHKAIRGDIQHEFAPPQYPGIRADSVYLKITLTDRALHQSNVLTSPLIILP